MKILLHQCCGPCSVYPVRILKGMGHDLGGYWFNPNIHPVTEFYKRLETLTAFDRSENIPLILDETYGLVDFLKNTAQNHTGRCGYCYRIRLEMTAMTAKQHGFDSFTSTLLYSRYQNHDLMVEIANEMASKYNVGFFYHDFREGWKDGIEGSKALGMYRQQYCGCIYSEEDRYLKQLSAKYTQNSQQQQ
ncbi:MAG: epoxyqueuosine reductase QueH [Deferribacterales bacterium]